MIRRWLPTVTRQPSAFSDGLGEDAEGWCVSLEWRGHIIEFSYLRRGALFGGEARDDGR